MKRRFYVLAAGVLILVLVFFYRTNPLRHAETFVSMYGDAVAESIDVGDGIPPNLNFLRVDFWEGENPMVEFVISGWGIGSGTRYYGCYYSINDVPLPYQNTGLPLVPEGKNTWSWTGEGDNHGTTRKLRDCWYYFEASF